MQEMYTARAWEQEDMIMDAMIDEGIIMRFPAGESQMWLTFRDHSRRPPHLRANYVSLDYRLYYGTWGMW